jgi:PBSX family phage portal protein
MSEKEKSLFRAIITDQGELIKIGKSDANASGGTEKLPEDIFGELYKTATCAKPPYNPFELIQLLEINTYHYKCIKQKALDVAGGFSILETESDKDADISTKKNKKKINDVNRKNIINFLDNCNPMLSFKEICKALMMDFNAVGWAVLEVIRNFKGDIIGLNHIPAHTCRYMLDGTGVVHRRLMKERMFKMFGDTEQKIDPNTGLLANEVIYMFDYSLRSDYYGIPDYIPAIGAMLANLEIRDFNINFFENGAVPQYAVVLEGGDLDDDTEEVIKAHFRDNIKGVKNAHKTLVISTPEGGKVTFQPLAVDVKDGHFRLYRMDNRDEIIQAHNMPPYRIGIVESGALGGNVAEEMTSIYKNSVIEPLQEILEDKLKKVFSDKGFFGGVTDWKIKFDAIDKDDQMDEISLMKTKAEGAKVAKESGVLTPDEIRTEIYGLDAYNDMDDVEDEIKSWAKNPVGYQAQPAQNDPQMTPDDPNGDGVGNPMDNPEDDDQNGSGSNYSQYDDLLSEYAKNAGSVQKSIVSVIRKKMGLSVDSQKVAESMRSKKANGFFNIVKSLIGIKAKPKKKKVADIYALESMFTEKLIGMFESMRSKIEKALPEWNLDEVTIEKADDEIDDIETLGFKEQYPALYAQLSEAMDKDELKKIMHDIMALGIEFGLSEALSEIKGLENNISFIQYDKRVSKFLDEYVFKASETTMDRLIGNVLGAIKASKEAGESIPQMQVRINETFIGMMDYETERIARTEATKSANVGRFEAYKEAGVKKKVWIGRDDGRERQSHIELNNMVVDIDEPFPNGLMFAGDPNGSASEVCNCRCSIGAIYDENEAEFTEKFNKSNK